MSDRRMSYRVGVMVIGTMIIAAFLITMSSRGCTSLTGGQYEIIVMLDEAPGVGIYTPVRKNGILVGRVTKISNGDQVTVVVSINKSQAIRRSDRCRVSTSLLGDAALDFVSAEGTPSVEYLEPGETIQGIITVNPLEMFAKMQSDLQPTLKAVAHAGEEVATLAASMNHFLGNSGSDFGRIEVIMSKSEKAIDTFTQSMKSFGSFVGDEEMRSLIKQGLLEFPSVVTEAKHTMQDARQAIIAIEKTFVAANENLRNLQGLTRPLGDNGEQIATSIISSAKSLEAVMDELLVFTQSVNSSEGSLSLFLNDRDLYENTVQLIKNTNHTVIHINSMTRNFERRMRPILDDVRVASDKIAREPGRLIGGAFNRHPSMK